MLCLEFLGSKSDHVGIQHLNGRQEKDILTHGGQHIQINLHYKSSKKSFDSKLTLSSLLLSLLSHCAPVTCTVTHSVLPGLVRTSTAANEMKVSQRL